MINTAKTIFTARRNGIVYPWRALKASQVAGIPFHVMCAFLEQETAGGQNVFGHDPTIFAGAGTVTKRKYLQYKAERKATGKMQGVGPMQLTWYAYQDEADSLGGCWNPYPNMVVGAKILHGYWNQFANWRLVGEHYNGSVAYGIEVEARVNRWAKILGKV